MSAFNNTRCRGVCTCLATGRKKPKPDCLWPIKKPKPKRSSDSQWRLSDQHQALLRLMLEEPTPKVSAAFKEQLAAYVANVPVNLTANRRQP
jgi:hypothetical protein